jgi:hypothetical protein
MTVIIRLPSRRSRRPFAPKRNARRGATTTAAAKSAPAGPLASLLKGAFYFLFLSIPFVTLFQTVTARSEVSAGMDIASAPPLMGGETVLVGPSWAYSVPFKVTNKRDIETLIQCESGGQNVSGPDSDGIVSDGILQFHRGPAGTMDRSTWHDFSRSSGITGSPMKPIDAIRMADWAISHGLGPRWTCWRNLNLTPGH